MKTPTLFFVNIYDSVEKDGYALPCRILPLFQSNKKLPFVNENNTKIISVRMYIWEAPDKLSKNYLTMPRSIKLKNNLPDIDATRNGLTQDELILMNENPKIYSRAIYI